MKKKIYIIGAGLAGLTAAYYFSKSGYEVEIFEASPHAGGRCRSFFDEKLGCEIDNGNHLIMGANTNVLALIKELGAEDRFNKFDNKLFSFVDKRNNERYYFKAPFPDIEYYGVLNFLNCIKFLLLPSNKTVKESFKLFPKFYEKVINPVSRSILNTASEVADANILRKVFLKMLISKNGFDYYYPKKNWSDALIFPLLERLTLAGVKINYNCGLKKIISEDEKIKELIFDGNKIIINDDIVIMATSPYTVEKLMCHSERSVSAVEESHSNINEIPRQARDDIFTFPDKFNPIINIHFKYNHNLKPQILGVINSNVEWIFVKPNLISTTFSAASLALSEAEIVKETWQICKHSLGLEGEMPAYRYLVEKRATFTATRQQILLRPKSATKYENLFLAGDYVENGLPATIEGAVLSGKNTTLLCE